MNEKVKQFINDKIRALTSDVQLYKYVEKDEMQAEITSLELENVKNVLGALDNMEELIKGKDEYIAKLCNDRAELKEHEKELIAEQHRLFDLAKEQENELKELKDVCEKGILKNKVICNVNLHYYLNKKSEIFNKLKTISNRLEEYHIQSDIVVGNHWGECWEFSAKGTTTLEIAEYICNFIRSQDLHAKIGYDDSHEFYLSA